MANLISSNLTGSSTLDVMSDINQTQFNVEIVSFNFLLPLISANLVISAISVFSQIVIILIAFGLEGELSAKTMMWVQAASEMLKRITSMLLQMQQFGKLIANFCAVLNVFP